MNRPPPYHSVVPLHVVQQGYQQYMNLGNTAVGGQTLQAPQLTATDPTIWQVQNHAGAPAFISTHFGRYEKRNMVAGHKVTPILRSDVAAGVSAKATSLRQAYPELIRHIKKPTFWDDLYLLWDAADIQLEGPEFLYYVMHRLGAENEQLDREFEEAQNNGIDEYARAWVTNHRELVLNSVAGSMYGLFISDPAENDDFAQEWRSILSKALEAHRLRLLQDDASNPVNPEAPKLLQSNSLPRKIHHQTTDTFHARAVSDKGDGLDQFGKRINRSNIPPAIGSQSIPALASERSHELNGLGSAQPQFTSTLHVGRNLSMPLNLTTQVQLTPVNQGETMNKVSALPLPLRPQTYDNFMEIQRNMTTGLTISPNLPRDYRHDNRFRDKPRPRGNSIEVSHNRRNQWIAPYGAQNKFAHQSQHNNQQNTSGFVRGSPSKASQPEPIYVRNLQHLQHTSGSSSHTPGQLVVNNDSVGSRMDLPNDARNHKTFQHSTVTQSPDFSPMEGDPNFQKRDDSCLYRYDTTPIPRNAHGRTLYLKGPDLKMFCSHQLKNLMSTVGNVVLIKFLLRPHNNGTVFVTFDTDVLEAAIKRFDGHQMPDGRLLTAGYPSDNHIRERSGSNSSYNSYHGEYHSRFMPNSGLDGRAYSRRSSISQHRPSRSQSGQSQFQYPNGNHMNSQNAGNSFPHISDFPKNNSYPAPHAPRQHLQSPRLALGAVISEVMQHERGMSHFQQQMPLTAMNNRANSATTSHPRSHVGFQGASNNVNTKLETDPTMSKVSGLLENRKENSPIKSKLTGDTHSTSPSKDSSRNTDIKHKKSSRRNTSTVTSPIATPTISISQVKLNRLAGQKSINHAKEVPPLSEVETNLIPVQILTTETTVKPEALTFEMTKQVPMAVPAPSISTNKLLPIESLETVAPKLSEPIPQGKIKNSKRNRKSKPTNKLSIEKESSVFSSTSATNSPADSQSTNPLHVDEDKLFSGDSNRKPGICSLIESKTNNSLNDTVLQSKSDEIDAAKPIEGETFTKSLENEITEFISATNITSGPNPSNVPAFKSYHNRSKTGGPINGSLSKIRSTSAKDLKRLAELNNSDNYDSSRTRNGSAHKFEHKTVISQGKNSGGGSSTSSGSQEQLRVDLIKNKAGLPHMNTSHEKGKSSGSEISTKSVDWPALTLSKSPPSSIADGKPPQVLALPTLSFRQTKTVILPALPLKPRRQLNDTLGNKIWPFVKKCNRKI